MAAFHPVKPRARNGQRPEHYCTSYVLPTTVLLRVIIHACETSVSREKLKGGIRACLICTLPFHPTRAKEARD